MQFKKRLVSCILIFVMITAALIAAGCGENPDADASSNDVSSVGGESSTPEGSSEGSSEESTEPLEIDTERIAEIDALMKNLPDRTRKAVNVAKGTSYTVSAPAHESYPDANLKKLTDGESPLQFNATQWAGYNKVSTCSVVINLGSKGTNISDFVIRSFYGPSYAINISLSMTVYISQDGEEFTKIGTAITPDPKTLLDSETYDYALKLQGMLDANYVRFDFEGISSSWFFLGEIQIIKYEGEPDQILPSEVTSEEFYGKGKIVYSAEEKLWNTSESDYNTYQNLLKGLIPDISMLTSISKEHATDHYNQLPSNKKLTDGKYATKTTYSDTAFFRMTRGDGRIIIFDLGALSTVDKLVAGFLKDKSSGVSIPVQIFIYGSADGIGWQSIGIANQNYTENENEIMRIEKQLDKSFNIRYLKIYIVVSSHAYCDEIELFGTKKIQANGSVINPEEDPVVSYRDRYIAPNDFLGVNNMLLSYHCAEATEGLGVHREAGLITVDEYLPHVGYYNTDGKLVDTLFDSFLYLPYTGFNYSDLARSAEGWKYYVENPFIKDRNVDALNQATKIVKDELKLDSDYKSKVFFSILYTFRTLEDNKTKNNFGDLDGDGINEDFSNIEDRKKVIKWIVDVQLKSFNDGNYEHLEVGGFYWFEEHIEYSDPHEIELISFARDYLHSLGMKIFWIPYFRATGYNDWANLGFDLACMQPNYAFNKDADISRLYSNAEITKLMGMCVEIEINDAKNYKDVRRFKEYLYVGVEMGYMNAVKLYYQGGVPGAFYSFYQSDDHYIRSAYDELYLFAKGKLEVPENVKNTETPKIPDAAYEMKMNKTFFMTVPYKWDDFFEVKLVLSPKYGSLKLNVDGTFEYIAMTGFAGTDTFELYVEYADGASEKTVITINVLQQ